MPDKTPPIDGYASLSVTHHALQRERAALLRRRPGPKTSKPECLSIGHAWVADAEREGGVICLVCDVVRRP